MVQLGVASMAVDEQLLRRGRAARLHRGNRFRQLADANGDGVDRRGDDAGVVVAVMQQRRGMASEAKRGREVREGLWWRGGGS